MSAPVCGHRPLTVCRLAEPRSGRRVPVGAVAGNGSRGDCLGGRAVPFGLVEAADLLRSHPDGVRVVIWVVPGARRSEIVGLYDGALRVRVGVPAEEGKANRAAADLVARALGGRRGEVVSGAGARRKQVLVSGVSPEEAAERLSRLLTPGRKTL